MNKDIAIRLATAGLHIFQACPETKRPRTKVAAARNDPAIIARQWAAQPSLVPAIAVAKCNLLVTDFDIGHKEGIDGIAAFNALVDQYGFPDGVPAVRTPRGSVHLYLMQSTAPYLSNATHGLPLGIDIRATPRNGYVIGPDAIMADGTFYEPIAGTPDLAEAFASGTIPEVPSWFLDIIDAAVAAEVERAASSARPIVLQAMSPTSAVAPGVLPHWSAKPIDWRQPVSVAGTIRLTKPHSHWLGMRQC
jgi:hypothetical protein